MDNNNEKGNIKDISEAKSDPQRIAITKEESDQLNMRTTLLNQKKAEIQQAQIEHDIFQNELNSYSERLSKKYNLSEDKKWIFDGTYFVEQNE